MIKTILTLFFYSTFSVIAASSFPDQSHHSKKPALLKCWKNIVKFSKTMESAMSMLEKAGCATSQSLEKLRQANAAEYAATRHFYAEGGSQSWAKVTAASTAVENQLRIVGEQCHETQAFQLAASTSHSLFRETRLYYGTLQDITPDAIAAQIPHRKNNLESHLADIKFQIQAKKMPPQEVQKFMSVLKDKLQDNPHAQIVEASINNLN